MDGCLRRDAEAATSRAARTRTNSPYGEARAGNWCEDGDTRRQRSRDDHRRIRAHAQLLEDRGRPHAPQPHMAVDAPRGDPDRRLRARRRRHRDRTWRNSAPSAAGRRQGDRCHRRPQTRGEAVELPLDVAGMRCNDACRFAAARVFRSCEHRHAVPARRRRCCREIRPGARGPGGVPERRELRLLLRRAAVLICGERRAVSVHVCRDARRCARHRTNDGRIALSGACRVVSRGPCARPL